MHSSIPPSITPQSPLFSFSAPAQPEPPTYLNTRVTFEDQIAIRLEKLCLDFLSVIYTFKPSEVRLLSKEINLQQVISVPQWLKRVAEAHRAEVEEKKVGALEAKVVIEGLKKAVQMEHKRI